MPFFKRLKYISNRLSLLLKRKILTTQGALCLSLLVLFIYGGLGTRLIAVNTVGLIFSVLLVSILFLRKRKINLPGGTAIYVVFLFFFGLSILWSRRPHNTVEELLPFISGGLLWLFFYNQRKGTERYLSKIILVLGIAFGIMFFYNYLRGVEIAYPRSLHFPYTVNLKHYNIGDFWSIVLIICISGLIQKRQRYLYLIFGLFGILILALSLSRSAYLSLYVGGLFLMFFQKNANRYKKLLIIFSLALVGFFVFAGLQKPILYTRQYYFQGILGLINKPFGVGAGNFDLISMDESNHIFGFTHFSRYAHNIFLEIFSGMGVLGLSFIAWFMIVLSNLLKNPKSRLLYKAIFIALTANFFFHSTYLIPTMLWLWFISLGLAQEKSSKVAEI